MKMYIPEIGNKIQLLNDWSFNLYPERRNDSLIDLLNKKFSYNWLYEEVDGESKAVYVLIESTLADDIYNKIWRIKNPDFHDERIKLFKIAQNDGYVFKYLLSTIHKDSILTIDRVYIRKGASDYSSISFRLDKKV